MQITIGAKCWDGQRNKTLSRGALRVEGIPVVVEDHVTFKDRFRAFKDPKLLALLSYAVPVAFLLHGLPPFGISTALAATAAVSAPVDPDAIAVVASAIPEAVKGHVMRAFDPLIQLIVSLSYPIAGVMIAGGCLMIMVQQREKGMSMLQNAAIGYILVQLSPMILQLLVGIGGGL
jgi:hypothetical protein